MKKMNKYLSSIAASLLIITALNSCTQKAAEADETIAITEFNLETAKAEIEEANKNFMALVAAGDSVGLANAYTIDAKFMSAGAPSVVGRAGIQTAMSGIVESGITSVDMLI
jgi:hypothetical protein